CVMAATPYIALQLQSVTLSFGVFASASAGAGGAAGSGGAGGVDGGARPELDRIEDFLSRFPGWAVLLAGQHRRLGQLTRVVAALNDRISHDPHLSSALHEVLSAVSSVRSTAAILAETEDIAPEWRARFHGNLHADSERLAAGAEALVAYLDGSDQAEDQGNAAPQDEVEGWLGRHGWHLAALEAGGAGAAALEAEIAALASGAARALARAWLAQAQADVAALPLVPFRAAQEELGPDPVLLARRFGAGVLAVFRRLATLPGAPEGLVICDASGTLLIAKPIEGFALPRFGAACPLWPLYTALSRPMVPVEALAEVPGLVGARYHIRAFCEPGFPEGFGGVEVRAAAMLIAPAPAQAGSAAGAAKGLLLGSSCRICPRAGCAARREPSIMAEFS
ncbi:MAG: short-chain fatty acyl-CoA regulator family protein, partial [Paracoccaceae bacterium]|nr:short-chain fatty acyl-CoA regulator family protein [Paracoccaceae bacterium]